MLAKNLTGDPLSGEDGLSIFDLNAFKSTPLQHDPYDFIIVPGFVKAEALDAVNRDYPRIESPGASSIEQLTYGPAFGALVGQLTSPAFEKLFAEKFGIDLSGHPTMMTIRKYSEPSDGNIHTDSRTKVITILIYFNEQWSDEGGKLRVLRSADNMEDYAAEVPPLGGTLLAFRRSDNSFHGFKSCGEAERRSLQMHWVDPKRVARREQKQRRLKTRIKRLLKLGSSR